MRWLVLACIAAGSTVATAAPGTVDVQVRVVEAQPGQGPPTCGHELAALAADLRSLPFRSARLRETEEVTVNNGARASLELPANEPNRRRFLTIDALGREADGKLRLQLGVAALDFSTRVNIPDGGTTMLVLPGHRVGGVALILIVTTRSHR